MQPPRWSRRDFLVRGTAAATLSTLAGCEIGDTRDGETAAAMPSVVPPTGVSAERLATDQAYWARVRANYDLGDEVIQLENGYWGVMSRPVLARYEELTRDVNRRASYYARREFGQDAGAVRARAARSLGVDEGEIAFTRNATEALQTLIGGYNRLRPGDAVLYADLDYPSAQYAMDWLRDRRGVDVVRFDLPEPATRQGVLDAYARALDANPRVRLVLVTHLGHRTGLVMPVREISELAAARGADVVLDAAHSFGQMEFSVKELGAPFIAFNLHKWIGAPLGVGVLYIAGDRLGDIDPHMADRDAPADDVRSRIHTGTMNFAALLSVPTALDFHETVGVANKEARLKRLRALWAEELRGHPGIEILTPDDDTMHAGMTGFRLAGRTSTQDNIALVRRLTDEFGVFTVHRTGAASGACVRVTPAPFTSEHDVVALREALVRVAEG